jgi:hypothetical protein
VQLIMYSSSQARTQRVIDREVIDIASVSTCQVPTPFIGVDQIPAGFVMDTGRSMNMSSSSRLVCEENIGAFMNTSSMHTSSMHTSSMNTSSSSRPVCEENMGAYVQIPVISPEIRPEIRPVIRPEIRMDISNSSRPFCQISDIELGEEMLDVYQTEKFWHGSFFQDCRRAMNGFRLSGVSVMSDYPSPNVESNIHAEHRQMDNLENESDTASFRMDCDESVAGTPLPDVDDCGELIDSFEEMGRGWLPLLSDASASLALDKQLAQISAVVSEGFKNDQGGSGGAGGQVSGTSLVVPTPLQT